MTGCPTAVLVAIVVSVLSEQGVATTVRLVFKIESRWVGAAAEAAPPPAPIQQALPDGSAEWEVMTNGGSFRSTLHGRLRDLQDGTVVLQPVDEQNRYILNPTNRTYEVTMPPGTSAREPIADVIITPGTGFETIAGYKAQKVEVSFRKPLRLPSGAKPAAGDMLVQITNWCVADIGLPEAVVKAINDRVQAFSPRSVTEQAAKHCPVALRSSWRELSRTPDYAIISTITSVRRLSGSPVDFHPPKDYRQVARP